MKLKLNEQQIELLIGRLQAITSQIGYFPAALSGAGEEHDYEERNAYQNAWNDVCSALTTEFDKVIESFTGEFNETYKCQNCNGKGYTEDAMDEILTDDWEILE